jgi:hypothetical protein
MIADGEPWKKVKNPPSLGTISAIKHHAAAVLDHKLAVAVGKNPSLQSAMAAI